MDCNFLMKSYLHFNLERMKLWMTELFHVKLYHCSINRANFAKSHVWRPCFLPAHLSIVNSFLTALPWKSYFPLASTRLWPSITGHNDAGNTQGRLGLHLATHICKAFHSLRRLVWASQNNNVRSRWGWSLKGSECIWTKPIMWHPQSEIILRAMTCCFPFVLLISMINWDNTMKIKKEQNKISSEISGTELKMSKQSDPDWFKHSCSAIPSKEKLQSCLDLQYRFSTRSRQKASIKRSAFCLDKSALLLINAQEVDGRSPRIKRIPLHKV